MSHPVVEQPATDYRHSYPPVSDELLSEIVTRILSVGSPLKIVLFGSRARGDHKPDSDIDILIIEESDADIEHLERVYDKALSEIYPERTVLVRSALEVEQWKYVRSYITTEALSQGRILYESSKRLNYAQAAASHQLRVAEEPEYRTAADLARLWFEKGDTDLFVCQVLLERQGAYEMVCFHAQQAVEKYLKGVLALHQQPSEKTHNLPLLVSECLKLLSVPGIEELDLETMTEYAVKPRYDGTFRSSRETAEQAYRLALSVRDMVLARVPVDARPGLDSNAR